MDCKTIIPLLFLTLLVVLASGVAAEANVPAIFIFGDSTADVGNNDYLPTRARANFPYYGIDFPNGTATGRFSNGFNSADEIARKFGFKMSPPPFLALTLEELRAQMSRGINFASGAAGIFDHTGSSFGTVLPMGLQVQHFATVSANLTASMGSDAARLLLSKSLFLLSVGSNDLFEYSNNSSTAHEFFNRTPVKLIADLMWTFKDQLKDLHGLGARKFGIVSVPPVGCCPSKRLNSGECDRELNDLSRRFYNAMLEVLRELQSTLPGMKYSLGNGYEMVADIIKNPGPFKMKEVKEACCGLGKYNGKMFCIGPSAKLCPKRDEYLFWDWYHPTQRASRIAAATLYEGLTRYVTPINFKQLAED